jgi:hypothetical protein
LPNLSEGRFGGDDFLNLWMTELDAAVRASPKLNRVNPEVTNSWAETGFFMVLCSSRIIHRLRLHVGFSLRGSNLLWFCGIYGATETAP